MAHTKTFKAGEVAYGGLIQVSLNNKIIHVRFLDWNTKKEVVINSFSTKDSRCDIQNFVEENSTYYWACQVVEWLDTKVPDSNAFKMTNYNWLYPK